MHTQIKTEGVTNAVEDDDNVTEDTIEKVENAVDDSEEDDPDDFDDEADECVGNVNDDDEADDSVVKDDDDEAAKYYEAIESMLNDSNPSSDSEIDLHVSDDDLLDDYNSQE